MDTNTVISIIVALIAIVPGAWALFAQATKDANAKEERLQKAYALGELSYEYIKGIQDNFTKLEKEKNIDTMWKKLYEKPVIVRCKYCDSPNTISNLNCIQCGAPIKE